MWQEFALLFLPRDDPEKRRLISIDMNWKRTILATLLLTLGMFAAGCAEHRGYRVYDPYYSDYHEWTPDEDAYYHRWYGENYHDRGYRDYKHLNRDEQRNYWNWRHAQGGDRDRNDHDRH